jgi:hypothetical protein
VEVRTLRQASTTMPSRSVSILRFVDGQVVDAGGKETEVSAVEDGKSRNSALWQFFGLMDLLPAPGFGRSGPG